jgi:hypothetical protein
MIVRGSVDLDNRLGRRAVEISDEQADRVLLSKTKLAPVEAQQSP